MLNICKKNGFTLAEIMVTLTIIGIVATLFVMGIRNKQEATIKLNYKTSYQKIDEILSQIKLLSNAKMADKDNFDWLSDKYTLSNLKCRNKEGNYITADKDDNKDCFRDVFFSVAHDLHPVSAREFPKVNIIIQNSINEILNKKLTSKDFSYIAMPSGIIVGMKYLDPTCGKLGYKWINEPICGIIIVDTNGRKTLKEQEIKEYNPDMPSERYLIPIIEKGKNCACPIEYTSDKEKIKDCNGQIDKINYQNSECRSPVTCYLCKRATPILFLDCSCKGVKDLAFETKDFTISINNAHAFDNACPSYKCWVCDEGFVWEKETQRCIKSKLIEDKLKAEQAQEQAEISKNENSTDEEIDINIKN